MITFEKNEKNLTIPSALGNFGNTGGSGGGVTPEEVEDMIESAITEYDAEVQVDLEDIRENVSGNTESIAELSAFTETLASSVSEQGQDVEQLSGVTETLFGSVSALTGSVDNLAGATTALTQGLETLSGTVATNAENITSLSGATEGVAQAVETLSGSLSAYTTTDTFNEGITGVQGQISGVSEDVAALSAATIGKQDVISAGNGIEISGATVSVKAGEGLGFSGDTLVVSGITGGDEQNFAFFNLLKDYGTSGDEVARLYNDMEAANASGKTVVLMSAFKDSTQNIAVFVQCQKDLLNGNYYGYGSGGYYANSTFRVGRAIPIFKNNDYTNVTAKNGHFYFNQLSPFGEYTLPTASSTTKGGIKVGSGLTIDSEKLSVKYGEGLGMSGDTLVVSGNTGGGIPKVQSLPTGATEGDIVQLEIPARTVYTIVQDMSERDWDSGVEELAVIDSEGWGFDAGYELHFAEWNNFREGGYFYRVRRDSADTRMFDFDIPTGSTIELGSDAESDTLTSTTIPSYYQLWEFQNGAWIQIDREWSFEFGKDGTCGDLWKLLVEDPSDIDYQYLTIRFRPDGVEPNREFKIFNGIHYYGASIMAADTRGSENWNRLKIQNWGFNWASYQVSVMPSETVSFEDIQGLPLAVSYCRFGNDEYGWLHYDADNQVFYYDFMNGDTPRQLDETGLTVDLVDWRFTYEGLVLGQFVDDVKVENLNRLYVTSGGTVIQYTHPSLAFKPLAVPYTIDDYTFNYEVTYRYTDWLLKIDLSEGNNAGANIRITAL